MPEPPIAGLDACTRCGLCLQACPTYRLLGTEGDSPRGRVFLIDALTRKDEVTAATATHLSACLGCRACESACPSGVPYGHLLEYGRYRLERSPAAEPGRRGWRLFRRIAFEWLLPSRTSFTAAMAPARFLQRHPRLRSMLLRLPLPARLRRLIAMLPEPPRPAAAGDAGSSDDGVRRARAGVFTGCVMEALFPGVNRSLVSLLRKGSCEAVVPSGQWCCGALNVHAGERDHARTMARRNIEAFEAANVDAIIVDSAGCGAHMKAYGELLADDPAFAARAVAFSAKVKDAAEYLAELDLGPLRLPDGARMTYQDACHLAHGQRIREAPRALLRSIEGVRFEEMRDADRCCGAAGVYSLTHPTISNAVLDEKLRRIDETGADTVVVTNPGCEMQLHAGMLLRGSRVRIRHLVDLLDEASENGRRRSS